jgi:hypothetical protein
MSDISQAKAGRNARRVLDDLDELAAKSPAIAFFAPKIRASAMDCINKLNALILGFTALDKERAEGDSAVAWLRKEIMSVLAILPSLIPQLDPSLFILKTDVPDDIGAKGETLCQVILEDSRLAEEQKRSLLDRLEPALTAEHKEWPEAEQARCSSCKPQFAQPTSSSSSTTGPCSS